MVSGMADIVVAHLSDLHIGLGAGHDLWGRDPSRTLAAVLAELEGLHPDIALLSGDLTDAGDVASTQYVADAARTLAPTVRWLAGNHDNPASLRAVESSWSEPVSVGAWTVIPVESYVEGEWFGHITESEVARVERVLMQMSTPYAALAVHQPPTGMCEAPGCQLDNAAVIFALADRITGLKVVFSGHQHHAFVHVRDGVTYVGGGSTCMQVDHVGDGFEPRTEGPMFAVVRLGDNGAVSVDHREC